MAIARVRVILTNGIKGFLYYCNNLYCLSVGSYGSHYIFCINLFISLMLVIYFLPLTYLACAITVARNLYVVSYKAGIYWPSFLTLKLRMISLVFTLIR